MWSIIYFIIENYESVDNTNVDYKMLLYQEVLDYWTFYKIHINVNTQLIIYGIIANPESLDDTNMYPPNLFTSQYNAWQSNWKKDPSKME